MSDHGPDGAAYIANNGINFAGKGELLKVTGLQASAGCRGRDQPGE